MAALSHPHTCTLYDVGPDYLLLEYIEGDSPKGPLEVEKAEVHLAVSRQGKDNSGQANYTKYRGARFHVFESSFVPTLLAGASPLRPWRICRLESSAEDFFHGECQALVGRVHLA